jgi:hypothetical protein
MYATSKVGTLPLKRDRIIEGVRKSLGKIEHHSSEIKDPMKLDESGVSVGHMTKTANLVQRRGPPYEAGITLAKVGSSEAIHETILSEF